MESRAWIKYAAEAATKMTAEEVDRDAVQKEINQLFGSLQNPTLPSAYRLRDLALSKGYAVDAKVQNRLSQFENLV